MSQPFDKCEGAMLGHAIANNFQASTYMAIELSESLRSLKCFDSSDIMSRYLYLYYTLEYPMGEATKLVYENLKSEVKSKKEKLTRKDFIFTSDRILNASRSADRTLNGLSAGCNPAQRSYPLALYPKITDENLFNISCEEAQLTHMSPQAGQVSGIINLICRRLIKGDDWNDAIQTAFNTAPVNLSGAIKEIQLRYQQDPVLNSRGNPAFAPNVLHTTLYCITNSDSFEKALEFASRLERDYCPTLVGLLAGARWGVSQAVLDNVHSEQTNTLKQIGKYFDEKWKKQEIQMNKGKKD